MLMSEIALYIKTNYTNCSFDSKELYFEYFGEDWYEENLINDVLEFFTNERLGLCGCGSPEDTNEFIRRYLQIRKDCYDNNLQYEEYQNRYLNELNINTKNEMQYGVFQFMVYILNDKGFLCHGGSVGSSWLEKEGEMLLEVLNKWRKYVDDINS